MKKRLNNVVKDMTQLGLANAMGLTQPYISKIQKLFPQAWVYFDDQGKPDYIQYTETRVRTCTIRRKT